MKKINLIIKLFLILFIFIGCSKEDSLIDKYKLLPSVQKIENYKGKSMLNFNNIKIAFSPSGIELPIRYDYAANLKNDLEEKSQIIYKINSNLNVKKEGYIIEIENNKIKVKAKDKSGLFYAFITINQLLEDSKDQNINLPIVKIIDYPSISFRPIHIDVKHHLEKEFYYYELIDQLARQKINGIILEFEDKIKYERRPLIGSQDALSIEKWTSISDYAIKRNIEVNPLVQGLGHASFILKHEKYKSLRDLSSSDWAFNPLDPETYNLQFDLYLDAIKATPHSKYLHVGGDEVYLVERDGKSQLELNLIWLNKVCDFAKKHNRTPIFWDDMPLKHAKLYNPMFDEKISKKEVDEIWKKNEHLLLKHIEKFPKNAVYMRWNYQLSQSYGNQKALDWYKKNELNVMGATAGQTTWRLMPQNQSNIPQIRTFAINSIERNLDGLLLTLWDDSSPHFELYKRGISAFSEYSWRGNKSSIHKFKEIYRHRNFGHKFSSDKYSFIDKLEKPVALHNYKNLLLKEDVSIYNISKTGNHKRYIKDPINNAIIDLPDQKNKGLWILKNSKKINSAKSSLIISKDVDKILDYYLKNKSKNTYTLQIYKQVNELVKFSSKSIMALEELDFLNTKDRTTEKEYNLIKINNLLSDFDSLRKGFENTYSKTRVINKPSDYVLDSNHHPHLANLTNNFDWQFLPEILFLEKINNKYIRNGK